MKCSSCGSEWNVSTGFSRAITACPFCGKTLIPEKKKLDTVEDVLCEINRLFGSSVFSDRSKLIGCFTDLAPHLTKQRRILSYFAECNGPREILAVCNASGNEKAICIKKIVFRMKDEMFIEESASRMICEAFLFAVSGAYSTGTGKNEPDAEEAETVEIVVEEVSQGERTVSGTGESMTAEEQYQKGEEYHRLAHQGSGDPSHYPGALEWFQKAALRGHPMAQYRLGIYYERGKGVERDISTALAWYERAAGQGLANAKCSLAFMYEEGRCVAKNIQKSRSLFREAAESGDQTAQVKLGLEFERDRWGIQDYSQAVFWYRKAAEQGNGMAMSRLGACYEEGKGVDQSDRLAIEWYEKALGAGDSSASYSLERLKGKMGRQETRKNASASQPHDHKRFISEVRHANLTSPNYVDALVLKHRVESRYLPCGTHSFQKKIGKAIRAYATGAEREKPLLMEDGTLFGSAKQGFVMTDKTLYWNDDYMSGRGQCSVDDIIDAGIRTLSTGGIYYVRLMRNPAVLDSSPIDISATIDKELAERMVNFWTEALLLKASR